MPPRKNIKNDRRFNLFGCKYVLYIIVSAPFRRKRSPFPEWGRLRARITPTHALTFRGEAERSITERRREPAFGDKIRLSQGFGALLQKTTYNRPNSFMTSKRIFSVCSLKPTSISQSSLSRLYCSLNARLKSSPPLYANST